MARTTLGLIALIGISVVFILVGIGFLVSALVIWRRWVNLQQNGVLIEGQITEHSKTRQGEAGSSITYTYEYEGKAFSRIQDVSKKYYQAWGDGSTVPVRCLAKQPDIVALVGDRAVLIFPLSICLFSAVLLLGSAIALLTLLPLAIHAPVR